MNAPARRLLLVDDDSLVLATTSRSLQASGYDVRSALFPGEAMDILDEFQPELALLDIRMGLYSGFDLARVLRDVHKIPFMFLSAYGDRTTVEEATELGAVGFLVKPIDIPSMVPAIEAALKRAGDLARLRTSEKQLEQALDQQRNISVAIGILMERHHWTKAEAELRLRETARSQRRKMADLAEALVFASETLARSAFAQENPVSRDASRFAR